MKPAAILLVPIVFLAAAANAAPPPERGGVTVRLGETVRVHGVRITPLRVIEDSRCPQDVRCVWAGRVRLSVRIGNAQRELTLGRPVPVMGGTLRLAAVLPERATRDSTIPPRSYRFAFHFQRDGGLELIRERSDADRGTRLLRRSPVDVVDRLAQ